MNIYLWIAAGIVAVWAIAMIAVVIRKAIVDREWDFVALMVTMIIVAALILAGLLEGQG